MDADSSVSADLVLVALSAPRSRPPPALPCRATRMWTTDREERTSRAAVGWAGSFNSGKNVSVLPVVEVRRTGLGTGKNVVLPD